ncbi:MAG: nuclear transport factor 2 family protein [Frankiaceae bacterium]|nr:nuclear transport factor 2 family protein [Frankiaceae bacterium]
MAITDATLRAFLAAFNAHDVDAVMGFFTDDCVFETPRGPDPWGTRLVGPAAVRTGIQGRFDGIPDVRYDNDEHWVVGDDHAVSRWTLSGTSTEGTRIEVRGCDLFDVSKDGRILRKDSYWKIVT